MVNSVKRLGNSQVMVLRFSGVAFRLIFFLSSFLPFFLSLLSFSVFILLFNGNCTNRFPFISWKKKIREFTKRAGYVPFFLVIHN